MKTLIQAVAMVLFASSAAQGQQAVQWRVQDGGNGHWYQLRAGTTNVAWPVAANGAIAVGGHLATLTSLAENLWVFQHVAPGPEGWFANTNSQGQLVDWYGPWLGGYQDTSAPDYSEPSGAWRWISGEAWSFSAWAPTLPNDGWNGVINSHHLRFHSASIARVPEWNDDCFNTCGQPQIALGYVVEWSADCNADGIVDYGQILQGQLPDTNTNGIPDGCECFTSPTLPACCAGDLNQDRFVDGADLGILLNAWGACPGTCPPDLNRDGFVDGSDLGTLLGRWGGCNQ